MFKATICAGVFILCASEGASAYGLRSHLWIADQVYQDLDDCRLKIAGDEFEIDPERCQSIRLNRPAFMAGALGPDIFPDLIIGQTIVHPGVAGGSQANDWLSELLLQANGADEIAFSWGYAMHYAGDIFAHTYVNNYSGDTFDLLKGGTANPELRHFRLEKYIDQSLRFDFDPSSLEAPAPFLARVLVRRDYRAAGKYPDIPTRHMSAIFTALRLANEAKALAPTLLAESQAELE
nr:zinc dependent phospholipase C family protein [Nitrospira sp.]